MDDIDIQKNIYDLEHDANLQRCHTIINLGMTLWLALIAGILTWIIEGEHGITKGLIISFMILTSVLFALTVFAYLPSKIKRNRIINRIDNLKVLRQIKRNKKI